MADTRWSPDKCPITGRHFFCWIEDEDGTHVPTYGGPFDSYTLPVADGDGGFTVKHYDHDLGGWRDYMSLGVRLIDDQREDHEWGTVDSLNARIAELEAALAQQAGAVANPVDWIAENHHDHWVVQVLCGPEPRYYSIRKSDGKLLELPHKDSPFIPVAGMFASSAPGGGGEVAAPDAGDYVLATKYGDGDPGDRWAIGFYAGATPNGRHLINDGDGKSIHAGGYRRVGKITQTQGDWLWRNRVQLEQYRRGENLWELIESLSPKEQV